VGWGTGDDSDRAHTESANALRQTDAVVRLIDDAISRDIEFRLTKPILCELNRLAVDGLIRTAGQYRKRDDIEIVNSAHRPPPAKKIPEMVAAMCEHPGPPGRFPARRSRLRLQEDAFSEAIVRSAYAMWRLNWIHPFDDGNGRTARAASYLVLCTGMRWRLPGKRALPSRIKERQIQYWRCLQEADAAWQRGRVDVSAMARLIFDAVLDQLRDAVAEAPAR
jgi:Fic family protein